MWCRSLGIVPFFCLPLPRHLLLPPVLAIPARGAPSSVSVDTSAAKNGSVCDDLLRGCGHYQVCLKGGS